VWRVHGARKLTSVPVIFQLEKQLAEIVQWLSVKSARNFMHRILLHPDAEAELYDAALYYEGCCPQLGEDFLNEYELAIQLITQSPARWRKFHKNNRKINLKRFPYGIIYEASNGVIYVKAVMHLHRLPFYWRQRLR